jgi:hypothetical protein
VMHIINIAHVTQFTQLVIWVINEGVWVIYYIITGSDDVFVLDNVAFFFMWFFDGMMSTMIMLVCCNLSMNVCGSILYSFCE